MVTDMYSRICTKISFLHVLSTLRALPSTLRASAFWKLSKKHQKIDENRWKFVKNLLSWNMFLIMLDAFWIQKNMFKVQKHSLQASEHLFSVHGGVFWVKSPQEAKISSKMTFLGGKNAFFDFETKKKHFLHFSTFWRFERLTCSNDWTLWRTTQ